MRHSLSRSIFSVSASTSTTCAVSSRTQRSTALQNEKSAGRASSWFPFMAEKRTTPCSSTSPILGVLFVGDFIMPYLGAPFVVEGDFQGLLDAIDIVVQKNPRYMLHGHEP